MHCMEVSSCNKFSTLNEPKLTLNKHLFYYFFYLFCRQNQVQWISLWCMHGLLWLPSSGSHYEPTVPLCARRTQPGDLLPRRHQKGEQVGSKTLRVKGHYYPKIYSVLHSVPVNLLYFPCISLVFPLIFCTYNTYLKLYNVLCSQRSITKKGKLLLCSQIIYYFWTLELVTVYPKLLLVHLPQTAFVNHAYKHLCWLCGSCWVCCESRWVVSICLGVTSS